jgi:AcrR family transcriptional regulator
VSSQLSEVQRRGLNQRQAETVERLWDAGLAELREVGHEALTIRTVALRAGVSAATAYTYLSSKSHLFAELFWRHLVQDETAGVPVGASVIARVQAVTRETTARIVTEPELAAAVTPALLGNDPDVARLRLRIGAEFVRRFEAALAGPERGPVDPALLEALALAFSGALLNAGMGIFTYAEMADRLEPAVAVIVRGNA